MKELSCCVVSLLTILLLKWMMFRAIPRISKEPLPADNVAMQKRYDIKQLKRKIDTILKDYTNNYPRCTDINLVSDPNKTKIKLKDNSVHLGGIIRLDVQMFDGYGKAKTVGGDHLRARLFTKSLKAYSAGNIYDHKNGTYSVHITALWSGQATVEIELVFPSELIASAIYTRRTWDFSDIKVIYRNNNSTEEASCSPYLKHGNKGRGVCDYSYWNHSMPWFCGKPIKVNMTCKHLFQVDRDWRNYTDKLNKCEMSLANRWRFVVKRFNVTILPKRSKHKPGTVEEPYAECTKYDTTKLWYNEKPTGYFFDGKWKLRHCRGMSTFNGECLRNKKIYLWGDSTLNQWFKYIRRRAQSRCKVRKGARQWSRGVSCYCGKFNILLKWMPHTLAFIGSQRKESKSLHQLVGQDRHSTYSERILVINLYLHIQTYSFAFFVSNLLELRKNIESLLKDDSKLKVFIKLPHTHREIRHKTWIIRQPDIIGYIHTSLLRIVFTGLYQKVIVLDNKDATNAVRNFPIHPSGDIVEAMVGQLLGYVCNVSEVKSQKLL